jgi:hypothetical protein
MAKSKVKFIRPPLPQNPTPDDFIAAHKPEHQAIMRELRSLIAELFSTYDERVYTGWWGLGYRLSRRVFTFAIFPQHDCVRLGFEQGFALPDPGGILTGDGTQVRYVILESVEDVHSLRGLKRE